MDRPWGKSLKVLLLDEVFDENDVDSCYKSVKDEGMEGEIEDSCG